ncbi:MAG: CvpA family protein [Bacteroidota bacterium]
MNYFDIILAIILGIGLFKGLKNGFIVEVTSFAGLILGIYAAMNFSYFLSNILKSRVGWDPSVIQVVSFAGTFIIVLILISLAGKILTKIAETIALGIVNKFFGAMFGLLKVGLIVSVVLIIFDHLNKSIPFVEKEKVESSILYQPVRDFAPAVFPKLVKEVEKRAE